VEDFAREDGGDSGRVGSEHFGADAADRSICRYLLNLAEEGVAWQCRLWETQFAGVRNADVRSGWQLVGVRDQVTQTLKESCRRRVVVSVGELGVDPAVVPEVQGETL
ncbi:hypothetical protein ADL27_50775, partial [Streptomyces sp. NRRL F-6602]